MQYKLAALGGTFDHFHKGHQKLIKHAFDKAEKIIVGVTDEVLTTGKEFSFNIQGCEVRADSVRDFARSLNREQDLEIVKLTDGYGPTLGQREIDVLVCSPLTEKGANLINEARIDKNLSKLPIEICELQNAEDGQYISSTRIRRGEISRDGMVYRHFFQNDIELSEKLRIHCKKPLGKLIGEPDVLAINEMLNKNGFNVAVGDHCGNYFWQNHIKMRMIIFDEISRRKEYKSSLSQIQSVDVRNEAGTISNEMARKVEICFWASQNIKVSGEEDLAAIPAIMLLPLGTKVFYGQPKEGLVVVEISEEKKKELASLIN